MLEQITNLQTVLLFIAFVLPGTIFIFVFRLLFPQHEKELRTQIIEAISASLINFVILFPLIYYVLAENIVQTHLFLAWGILGFCFVIMPALWPGVLLIALRFFERHEWINILAKTGYDAALKDLKNGVYIIIVMLDDRPLVGWFGDDSFCSSYPAPGHLYVEQICEVDEQGRFSRKQQNGPRRSLILAPKDYKYVMIVREEKEESKNEQQKTGN
jgi:hypothetical protein